MSERIRVFIVEDHGVVRSGLRLLLDREPDILVVGEAENGAQALEQIPSLRPDVVLMDISLPDQSGITVTQGLLKQWPQAKVVALTMHSAESYLLPFLQAGGLGYIRKAAADRDLLRAVRTVARGEVFLEEQGVQVVAGRYRSPEQSEEPPPSTLSEREREVLTLTARGFTSQEIGTRLALSPRTVETYRERLMAKLGLTHRSELVDYALRHHLLEH